MAVDDTLVERGLRYGDFADIARIAQQLQDVMRRQPGWDDMSDVAKQALTVIADKIARILSGDPNYADNWHDIQGYARLVEERLDPNFNFGVKMGVELAADTVAIVDTLSKGRQVKLIKPCCKHPNPNPKPGGMLPAWTYCINCGHRYKSGEIQDVGNQT